MKKFYRQLKKKLSMIENPSSPHVSSASAFEYDAFISYRTSMVPDALVGEELQKVLESYPVPKSLKQNIVAPRKFQSRLKIFRDITDLSAGGNLSEAIKQRLRASRWLIVVCSPNTPLSTYCNDEVRYFNEYHGNGRILHLLIKGEPHESFPLLSVERNKTSEASHNVQEMLAADIRAADTNSIIAKLRGKRLPKEKQARFKILAPILECKTPDELIQRHRVRVRRQIQYTVLAVLLMTLAVSWIIGGIWVSADRDAFLGEASRLLSLNERKSDYAAARYALAAFNKTSDLFPQYHSTNSPYEREESIALETGFALRIIAPVLKNLYLHIEFSPNDTRMWILDGKNKGTLWDAQKGILLADLGYISDKFEGANLFSSNSDRLIFPTNDAGYILWDSRLGKKIDVLGNLDNVDFSPDGLRMLVRKVIKPEDEEKQNAHINCSIWDALTGKKLIELGVSEHSDDCSTDKFSHDSSRFIFIDSKNESTLWDTKKGEKLISLGKKKYKYLLPHIYLFSRY
jgi:hypothetical protein